MTTTNTLNNITQQTDLNYWDLLILGSALGEIKYPRSGGVKRWECPALTFISYHVNKLVAIHCPTLCQYMFCAPLFIRSPHSATRPLPKINTTQKPQCGNGTKKAAPSVNTHRHETQQNLWYILHKVLHILTFCVLCCRRMVRLFLQRCQSLVSVFPP